MEYSSRHFINNNDHYSLRPQYHSFSQPTFYEQTVTTTTTTTINEECNSKVDEMTTTNIERSPLRRVNVVGGPRSAFARLFPERYRDEQDRIQRSKSTEDQRYNFDGVDHQYPNDRPTNLRRSHRVTFEDQDSERLSTRTKSEPFLTDTSHHYQNISSSASPSPLDGAFGEKVTKIPLNFDPEPEVIYRDNPDKLVYIQKVGVRYLKPPTPPPPGPLVIREVASTPLQEPPPLIVSTTPPLTPRTPSPLIVREEPPTPPQTQLPTVITKKLPPGPAPPRRVIIKRVPPLPAKPRPVIIEKWLPYKNPPERPVLYERAEHIETQRTPQRNVILQYDQAKVRVEQEIQNVGCYRVDPEIYRAQYGSSLRRTDSIRRVLKDIGCNPDLITSTGYKTDATINRTTDLPLYDYSQQRNIRANTTCFTDEQLVELIGNRQGQQSSSTSVLNHRSQPIYSSVVSTN